MSLKHLSHRWCPPMTLMVLCTVMMALAACSKDDESPYPAIITEMADLKTDENGIVSCMVTDNGTSYAITNELHGSDSLHTYRYICGYTIENDGHATLYTLQRVLCLADSTAHDTVFHHPLDIASIWRGGNNINMHLLVKMQGKAHKWGFVRDSTKTNPASGTTHYISLYHDRDDDPEAFTDHAYLTLRMDSVTATPNPADSLHFTIHSYAGKRSWRYGFPQSGS